MGDYLVGARRYVVAAGGGYVAHQSDHRLVLGYLLNLVMDVVAGDHSASGRLQVEDYRLDRVVLLR